MVDQIVHIYSFDNYSKWKYL